MKLNDKMKTRIRLCLGIAVSLMLTAVGILFIASCISIYRSGHSPFTRDSIGEAFSRIAIPTYLTISVIIVSVAVNVVMPEEQKKLKGLRTPRVQCSALAGKVNLDTVEVTLAEKIRKERHLRRVLSTVRSVLILLSAILPLFYLLDPHNFPAVSGEYNAEILHGMLLYLVFLAPVAVFEVFYVIFTDVSYTREQAMLKSAVKSSGMSAPTDKSSGKVARIKKFFKEKEGPITLGVRIAILGCSVIYIVLGILNGGMSDVLNKAIKICTECIGLG